MNKIRIPNEKLWQIAQNGESVDQWLEDNIGIGNYSEWFGFTPLPYRSWSFKREEDETLFILRWL